MCKCRICGNVENNEEYIVKERMLNRGDTFNYFLCSRCGTLQLKDFNIGDVGGWYKNNYYSFNNESSLQSRSCLKRIIYSIIFWIFTHMPMTQNIEHICWESYAPYMYLRGLGFNKKSKILDVGCGAGKWLDFLASIGFKNLFGIDMFSDKHFPGFDFRKTNLMQYDNEGFDLISFHHSFEHMDNPHEILGIVHRMLKQDGVCLIRVPVCGGKVWDDYKVDWYQIDAPRHYFLYGEEGMNVLCENTGFVVKKVVYDSFPSQFVISEYYRNTEWSLNEISSRITKSDENKFQDLTREINRKHKGDMAAFYLEKK